MLSRNPYYAWDRRSRLKNQDPIHELIHNIELQGYRLAMPDRNKGHWAYGWCHKAQDENDENLVVVFMRMPNGRFWSDADIAFLLAHEYMHIMHQKMGLFKSYYTDRQDKNPKKFLAAIAAERHCDKFAKEYIDQYYPGEKSLLRNRLYPTWRVNTNYMPDKIRYKRWFWDCFHEAKNARKKGKATNMDKMLGRPEFKKQIKAMLKEQGVKELVHA